MINTFDNIVPATQVVAYTQSVVEEDNKPVELTLKAGDVDITAQVVRSIGLDKFASAVESSATSCFNEDGEYVPWMEDVAFGHAVLSAYTNIELPDDLHELFDFIINTDVLDRVVTIIDSDQFERLVTAVRRKIHITLKERYSAREQELDRALAMLNFITQKYNEIGMIFNEIMGDDMKELMEKLRDTARDVSGEVGEIKEKLGLEEGSDKPPVDEGGEA